MAHRLRIDRGGLVYHGRESKPDPFPPKFRHPKQTCQAQDTDDPQVGNAERDVKWKDGTQVNNPVEITDVSLALGDGPTDVFDGEAKMIHGSDKTQSQASTNVANANEIVQRLEQAEGRYETMALWMDLLGFRTHLDRENWDLHGEQTKLGMKRIAAMHEVGLLSMNDRYEVVQLNDAIVISQDMPTEGAQNAVEQFLALVDYNFEMAVLTDSRIGGVGIRAVVAKGVRYNLRGNLGWTSQEADPKQPSFFCPRPIMMHSLWARIWG